MMYIYFYLYRKGQKNIKASFILVCACLGLMFPHFLYPYIPLSNFREEVKQVMQTGGVPCRQQTGQQLEGCHPVLQAGQSLGFEQNCMELRGKQRFWQLPAKLFDQSGHIVGEGSGQTPLSSIQLGLKTQQEQKTTKSATKQKWF